MRVPTGYLNGPGVDLEPWSLGESPSFSLIGNGESVSRDRKSAHDGHSQRSEEYGGPEPGDAGRLTCSKPSFLSEESRAYRKSANTQSEAPKLIGGRELVRRIADRKKHFADFDTLASLHPGDAHNLEITRHRNVRVWNAIG